ncbi:MAG: hypothetical protein ABIW46_08145, partial [Acidimicrobiales bacterium]
MSRRRGTAALIAGIALLAGVQAVPRVLRAPAPPRSETPTGAYGELATWFEPNHGQAATGVDFVARSGARSALLTAGGPVFSLAAGRPVLFGLVGAKRSPAEGSLPLAGVSNYLRGSNPAAWRTGVAHFGQVTYQGVWPGIDVVYRGQGAALEYDFVVHPGADPSTIAVAVEGADALTPAAGGDLVASVGASEIRQSAPVVYQERGGAR